MTVKAQIFEMINRVPETELPTLLEVVKHFVPVSFEDIVTAEDIAAHNESMREYRAGETVAHDAIDWG